MAQSQTKQGRVGRFVRWFAGAPFEHLPPEYGDTVPSDLMVFESEMAEEAYKTHIEPAHSSVKARSQRMSVHTPPDLERQ